MKLVTILYEDQLVKGGAPKGYGPHALIRALAEDALGKRPFALNANLRPMPLHGNEPVMERLGQFVQNGPSTSAAGNAG
ncbi:MAG: hypothetical protein HY904_13930 [Deltaproteobacteria bacterium]|nr:hypothetical protein [Deltaproteobacteria bacterium]